MQLSRKGGVALEKCMCFGQLRAHQINLCWFILMEWKMFEKKERSGKFDLGKESKRKASSGGQYDKGNHEQEK